MKQITIKKNISGIKDLTLMYPTLHFDNRGYFFESYNEKELKECGFDVKFVQDNQSVSHKGVLRGLHYQKNHQQGKLIRALNGSFYDVAVDLRKDSETFGKYFGIILSAENHIQLYIPQGFAHGFLSLEDNTVFFAKVTDYHHPGDGAGVLWNDPEIGIEWPLKLLNGTELIMTENDKNYPKLKDSEISILMRKVIEVYE